jgi:hypothetical protein
MMNLNLQELDTQRIGRMGELVAELELLSCGWLVGNFNATTANSAGWDLFATRGTRSVRIRVKAKRPGVPCFRWSAKADGTIFTGYDKNADDDYIAAVSFQNGAAPSVYVLPTSVAEEALTSNHRAWIGGRKRDGGKRRETSMRHLYIDDRNDLGHGYAIRWKQWQDAWDVLDRTNL